MCLGFRVEGFGFWGSLAAGEGKLREDGGGMSSGGTNRDRA